MTLEELRTRYLNIQRKRHEQRVQLKRLHKAYALKNATLRQRDDEIKRLREIILSNATRRGIGYGTV